MESINLNPGNGQIQPIQPNQPQVQPVAPPPPQEAAPVGQPEVPSEMPGYGGLLKMSFQLFVKNWLHFIKLTFIFLIPLVLIGTVLFFSLSKAFAAPKIPGSQAVITEEVNIDENTAADAQPESEITDIADTVNPEKTDNDETAPETDAENTIQTDTPQAGALFPESDDSATNQTTGSAIFFDNNTSYVNNIQPSNPAANMLMGLLMSSLMMIGIMILVFVLIWIYGAIMLLSFVRLTVLISQSAEIKAMEIIKWALKKLGPFIMLGCRKFIYTLAWISILLQLAQPFIIKALGLSGVAVMGIANLIVSILVFVRTVRTYFAVYVLAEDSTSKEALKGSVGASTGHWWKIVGYGLLNGLIITLALAPIFLLVGSDYVKIALIWPLIVLLVVFYSIPFFYYGLYHVCRMENANK